MMDATQRFKTVSVRIILYFQGRFERMEISSKVFLICKRVTSPRASKRGFICYFKLKVLVSSARVGSMELHVGSMSLYCGRLVVFDIYL